MSEEKHEGVLDVVKDMISGIVPAHIGDDELLLLYAKRLTAAYRSETNDVRKIVDGISDNILKYLDNGVRWELPQKCERCSEGFEVDCEYRGDPGGCNSGDPGYHPMLGKAGLRELELRRSLRISTERLEAIDTKTLRLEDNVLNGRVIRQNLKLLDGKDDADGKD